MVGEVRGKERGRNEVRKWRMNVVIFVGWGKEKGPEREESMRRKIHGNIED